MSAAPIPSPTSLSTARPLDIAIVIPTFNERGNIVELIHRLDIALKGLAWEVIFVDDDSPDDTAALILELGSSDPHVRLLHRIGRRGLSSACIEGILSTSANAIAVMDGDMQHDESILPTMLLKLRGEKLDLVVGSRNVAGGSMGEFGRKRVAISRLGQHISNAVCHCDISDPMSGFFLVDRRFFLQIVHSLHAGGFKILVDMLASSPRPVRFAEVGYTFRLRSSGESKLDISVGLEYLFLIIDKLTGRFIPTRFVAFSLVGAAGAVVHLLCMYAFLYAMGWKFLAAQIAATYIAMVFNFFVNNVVTWRDRKLRGMRMAWGLISFCVACSFGAWANVVFSKALLDAGAPWYLASIAGIVVSSVWNYSIANLFTW